MIKNWNEKKNIKNIFANFMKKEYEKKKNVQKVFIETLNSHNKFLLCSFQFFNFGFYFFVNKVCLLHSLIN